MVCHKEAVGSCVLDAKILLRKKYYELEIHYGRDIYMQVRNLCELRNEMREQRGPINDK